MLNLTLPVFIFGSLIAFLIGALVHLVAGGRLVRLIFCLVFSWIGFWVGDYLASRFNFEIFKYGLISYGPAIFAALIIAIFGYWISGENLPEGE